MKLRCIVIFCTLPIFLQAQVINTERLRINSQDTGWVGSINVSFSQSKSTIKIHSLNLRTSWEYVKGSSRLLSVGNLSLSKKDDTVNLANDGYLHIRYGYIVNSLADMEVFGQVQFHEFKKIGLRSLSGFGPRFRIIENDSLKCFLGTLYMYEYEKLFGEETFNRDHRLSAYISLAYRFTDFFFIDFITYYQPTFGVPADFRISSETIINFDLTQKLSFDIILNYGYDSQPPIGIPRINYSWNNTLAYTF